MLNKNSPATPAGREVDVWIVDAARTPLAAPGGALHEVQPAALLAGLIAALRSRNAAQDDMPWPLDALIVGAAASGGVAAATLPAALARAGASFGAATSQLEGDTEAGADAVRLAVAQLRAGEAQLVLAGAIHLPSRAREQRRANPDVLGALAAQAVSPRAAADVAVALQGIAPSEVAEHTERCRGAGAALAQEDAVEPVLDLNGLTVLGADDLCSATGSTSPAPEEPWQNHHALARKAFPQLGEIVRVHPPQEDAPLLEGASLLLLARADAARRLGLRARARIVACATAGHLRLQTVDAAVSAFAQALQRAGWSRNEIDVVEISSRFAGLTLALGRAIRVDGAQQYRSRTDWRHANAGALSPVMALAALVRGFEQAGPQRGALVVAGEGGSSVVILVERSTDD